jgi:aspartate kinase
MIVAKFGGAVLNGPDGVRRVRDEINRLPKPLLVVISAFANVTNRLEQLAETATRDGAGAASQLESLVADHHSIARDLLSAPAYAAWSDAVASYSQRLDEVVCGLAIVRELSPRTLDLIVHFGERFSSSIVHAAINDGSAGRASIVPALDVIITDTQHRYARPDLQLTGERVASRLAPALTGDAVVLTEGYIARSTAGEATTMGRESSDFSATLLGELLDADEVRIYTNVPGVLTADPTLISSARTLPRLSYGMARLLAELGAKVLHVRTVTPVERGGIPLVIRRLDTDGTTIGSAGNDDAMSIVMLPEVSLVTMTTTTTAVALDSFLRTLSARAPIIWHHRFRRRVQLVMARTIEEQDLPLELIDETVESGIERVSVVSLVSERDLSGVEMERFFGCIGEREVIAIQGGIDGPAISVALAPDAARTLYPVLHRQFVEDAAGDGAR